MSEEALIFKKTPKRLEEFELSFIEVPSFIAELLISIKFGFPVK